MALQKKSGSRFARAPRTADGYCALPCPLVEGFVAVALPEPVWLDAVPGPAVVPVVLEPPALPEGEVVDPLLAPERLLVESRTAFHSAREICPSPLRSYVEKSELMPRLAPAVAPRSLVGAFGSPAVRGLGTPPLGPVPVALAPDGPPLCARMNLSPSADACAARGTAKAPAAARAIKVLSLIAVS
jgi:hypothetical protein